MLGWMGPTSCRCPLSGRIRPGVTYNENGADMLSTREVLPVSTHTTLFHRRAAHTVGRYRSMCGVGKTPGQPGFPPSTVEPPKGIEPLTYASRVLAVLSPTVPAGDTCSSFVL